MVTPTKADLESFDFLVTERWQAPFFGVDHNRFKMGDRVFEAVENEIDGYRSDLGAVEVRKGGVFFLNLPCDVRKTANAPNATYWLVSFALHALKHGFIAEANRALGKISALSVKGLTA